MMVACLINFDPLKSETAYKKGLYFQLCSRDVEGKIKAEVLHFIYS